MNKKLLLLGGTGISQQIVYAARQIGLEVHVTDYLANSPCKKIADKSYMVDCMDIDTIVKLIKDEHINGAITGYADVLLPPYVQICEKAKIPCYATPYAIKKTTDKAEFKKLCRAFGIPVAKEYAFQDVVSGNAKFPLLIKPVDNSGARGIYICHNMDEFGSCYNKAMFFSRSKHVLIEEYITYKESTIFYYFHHGVAYLLGVSDRHMLKYAENMLPLPIGYTFPSANQHDYIESTDKKIKALFHSLGMKEGMAFLQAFNHNGCYIIYEMGYRLTGSLEHYLIDKAYGFNPLKALLQYAVGDEVDISPLKKANLHKQAMANVTLLLSKGTISHYEGIEKVMGMPGVLHVHPSYPVGTAIDDNIIGKLAQVGLRILLYADDKKQLLQRMDAVKDAVHIISTEGKDMLLRQYSYQEICQP